MKIETDDNEVIASNDEDLIFKIDYVDFKSEPKSDIEDHVSDSKAESKQKYVLHKMLNLPTT